ncbi:MAG: GntR family transcriptional regulator [Janthinobacterium lividum]
MRPQAAESESPDNAVMNGAELAGSQAQLVDLDDMATASAAATSRDMPAATQDLGAEPVLRSGVTVERTAEFIKQQILDGRLVPGQRLVSRDLIEQLGISRGPLREAFRHLAADGLVDLIPNRGAMVRRLSIAEIDNIYQIREALEGFATRRAAERVDIGDNRARFTAVLEQGRRHLERPNFQQFVIDNRLFHRTIVEMCDNPQLCELIEKYQLPVFMIQLRQLIGVDRMIANSIAEHEAIGKGILAGDPDAAFGAMHKHLWHSAGALINIPVLKT